MRARIFAREPSAFDGRIVFGAGSHHAVGRALAFPLLGGFLSGAAFQADKRDYRGVLAGLEGITGIQAVNSEAMTVKN